MERNEQVKEILSGLKDVNISLLTKADGAELLRDVLINDVINTDIYNGELEEAKKIEGVAGLIDALGIFMRDAAHTIESLWRKIEEIEKIKE